MTDEQAHDDPKLAGSSLTEKVDLENLEVDILIIAKNANELTLHGSYLRGKFWPTTVTSELSAAIEYIGTKRPDFIFVSLNHPSPTIFRFPETVMQAFNLTCIGFLEHSDPKSKARLNDLKLRYKLGESLTGESAYNYIQKVLAERFDLGGLQPVNVSEGGRLRLKDLIGLAESSATPEQAAELIESTKKTLFTPPPGADGKKPELLLEEAIESGISRVSKTAQSSNTKPLPKVSTFAVFPVDSSERPGYLVMAIPPAQAKDQGFVDECGAALKEAFQTMQVPAKIESAVVVDVPEVSFEPWAKESAMFNFKTAHNNQEVGVAYLSSQNQLPEARVTEENGMYAIDVEDIIPNETVGFKLYLYMKKNQRFMLYLRNGRRIQNKQIQNLKKHRVNEVYVKAVDLENLRQFLAANFIRQSIRKSNKVG